VVGVAASDVLNVRAGPGVKYEVKQTLQPDQGCIVQTGECRRNWVHIKANGETGWVNRRYLAIIH